MGAAVEPPFCVLWPRVTGAADKRPDTFADPHNLEVLPESITTQDLRATMKSFALGLGVRCTTLLMGCG